MKKLHRKNLYSWSIFNEERNIDFHSVLWIRSEGNVLIDPLPLSDHDKKHLESLGGAAHIIITNSDHLRDASNISEWAKAKCWGPAEEKEKFPLVFKDWLKDGNEPIPGLKIFTVDGSKTSGELSILLEEKTLITGDLIRVHEGGSLCMLPKSKLKNYKKAVESIKRMAEIKTIEAVLPGDGWPIFRNGHQALIELVKQL